MDKKKPAAKSKAAGKKVKQPKQHKKQNASPYRLGWREKLLK